MRTPASTYPVDQEDLGALVERLQDAYPPLRAHAFQVRRGLTDPERLLEFYPAWERQNPAPGVHLVEVRDPTLHGRVLEQLVLGDMLHALGAVDPRTGHPVDPAFRALKEQFRHSMTPAQRRLEEIVHEHARQQGQEHRPFDDYLDNVRLDAYLRAGLLPEVHPGWQDPRIFTPPQRVLLGRLRDYLTTGEPPAPTAPSVVPDAGSLRYEDIDPQAAGASRTLEGLRGAAYYGGERMEPRAPRFPRPLERYTPREVDTEREIDRLQDQERAVPTPSIVPSAAALAELQNA